MRQSELPDGGQNEFDLACARLEPNGDDRDLARRISDVIEAFRAETLKGPSLRPEAEWKQARKHSDELAERALLKGSTTLANSDALSEKAKLAQEAANTARQAMEKLWLEFARIPRKADELTGRLAAIADERRRLNVKELTAAYHKLYSARFTGEQIQGGSLNDIYLEIQQCSMRAKILDEIEPTLHAGVKALRKRDAELARQLDVKPDHL